MFGAADFIKILVDKSMNRLFELQKETQVFSFEVKAFASATIPEPALLVLAEVTNKSKSPFNVSSFSLSVGNTEINSTAIKEAEFVGVDSETIKIHTPNNSVKQFTAKHLKDFPLEPLGRPYLNTNESAFGLILFLFPENIEYSGKSIELKAKVAGFKGSLIATII